MERHKGLQGSVERFLLSISFEGLRFTLDWNLLQDTVTGFLLAGVGNVDLRRKTNYLVVDNSKHLFFDNHLVFTLFGADDNC